MRFELRTPLQQDALDQKEDIRVERIQLSAENKTHNKLESFFLLPKMLAKVLESSTVELSNVQSAKLFLLTRLKDIAPAILSRDKEQAIAALDKFVALWLESHCVASRLSFDRGCSIEQNCKIIWLPEIHGVAIASPKALRNQRDGWDYLDNFDLVETSDGFFVEVPFIRRRGRADVFAENKRPHISTRKTPDSNISSFGNGIYARELFKALSTYSRELDKIAHSYTKADFGALEGYQVQGGLPSLGKKR